MCIIHGQNSDQGQISQSLNEHIHEFFRFILLTLNKKYQPTVDYFNRAILLMGDMAKFYPMVVEPFKKDPAIVQAMETLK